MAGGARNVAVSKFRLPKHTLERRLRAARFSEEDRKALLGHKNGSFTTHYSAAELDQPVAQANRTLTTDTRVLVLTILKRRTGCPP